MIRLDHLNAGWQEKRLACLNDPIRGNAYYMRMAIPRHDWYLKEWLRTLGKRQADIARDLDWNKARVSLMLRGEQQYTRDAVNEMAAYLNLRPYELLMEPADAMAMRRIRDEAIRAVAESQAQEPSPEIEREREKFS